MGPKTKTQHLHIVSENLSMLAEVCHFCAQFDENFEFSTVFQELDLSRRQLLDAVGTESDPQSRLKTFLILFFNSHGYKPYSINSYLTFESALMDQVIKHSHGPVELVLLLFTAFAQELSIKVKVYNVRRKPIVKISYQSECLVIDFLQSGRIIGKEELVELVNTGADLEKKWSQRELLSRYLAHLKLLSKRNRQIKYKVIDALLKHQPFNLQLISERAQLSYEMGQISETIRDIKHYFVYSSPVKSTRHLIDLYRRAKKDSKAPEQ